MKIKNCGSKVFSRNEKFGIQNGNYTRNYRGNPERDGLQRISF